MEELRGENVIILDKELKRREKENRTYLMKLKSENLLFNYKLEAGRFDGREIPEEAHGGWESPVCQLRGHFLGHWMSAASMQYNISADNELKAKLDSIINELKECQKDNGGKWIGPIPEKYLYWIAVGKEVWAPQYNLHKILMGLVDAYLYTANETALIIAENFADWFIEWSAKFSKENFDDILDVETGGMLEIWAELLDITGKEKYKTLMERYYRSRLFQPLLEGKDPLTNMHANTTIPEVLGCARSFEVTGEKRWMDIVKAYWKCAITERGTLVTGGQTSGEIWMPKKKMKARLGDKNQEFCTVYNLMRMAEFLFRHTCDPSYAQFIEYNIYNGVMAQSYYKEDYLIGNKNNYPTKGLLTYFLPMKAGLSKDWSTETNSFFCCHGTMVQANAILNRGIYYKEQDDIYICQYFDSEMKTEMNGDEIRIVQQKDNMNGSMLTSSNTAGYQRVNDTTSIHENMPNYQKFDLVFHATKPKKFSINYRIPDWIISKAIVYVNGELHGSIEKNEGFYNIHRTWHDGDKISIILPTGIRFITLPDDKSIGAFQYGPEVLAGIVEEERILDIENENIVSELEHENERQWGEWRIYFKTVNQEPAIQFKRIRDVGYEPYQIYFKVKQTKKH